MEFYNVEDAKDYAAELAAKTGKVYDIDCVFNRFGNIYVVVEVKNDKWYRLLSKSIHCLFFFLYYVYTEIFKTFIFILTAVIDVVIGTVYAQPQLLSLVGKCSVRFNFQPHIIKVKL